MSCLLEYNVHESAPQAKILRALGLTTGVFGASLLMLQTIRRLRSVEFNERIADAAMRIEPLVRKAHDRWELREAHSIAGPILEQWNSLKSWRWKPIWPRIRDSIVEKVSSIDAVKKAKLASDVAHIVVRGEPAPLVEREQITGKLGAVRAVAVPYLERLKALMPRFDWMGTAIARVSIGVCALIGLTWLARRRIVRHHVDHWLFQLDRWASAHGCRPRLGVPGELRLYGFPTKISLWVAEYLNREVVCHHPDIDRAIIPDDGNYRIGLMDVKFARVDGVCRFAPTWSIFGLTRPAFRPISGYFEITIQEVPVRAFCVRDGQSVRFGIENNMTNVVVPLEIFVRASAMMYSANKTVYNNDITQIVKGQVAPHEVATLTTLWNAGARHLIQAGAILFKADSQLPDYNYVVNPSSNSAPPKPVGHQIGPALALAYVAARCKQNDEACIKYRVLRVANENRPLDPKYSGYRDEFLSLLPQADLVPLSTEEVLRRQNRPSQILPALAALPFADTRVVFPLKSFQKAEAYASLAPPRNITTVDPAYRVTYSRYTLAYSDYVMKRCTWYAFGRPPRDLCEAIHLASQEASTWLGTDFSKFDGSRHEFFIELEARALEQAFPNDGYYVRDLLMRQYKQRAVTAYGVKYAIGSSRLSGSPDTSLGNSLDNAFLAFCVHRETGLSPFDAWSQLGFYGGDDGITYLHENRDTSARALEEAYSRIVNNDFGMDIKIIVTHRARGRMNGEQELGDHRVPFLGREFVNPWESCAFIADVPRQIAKAHISCAPTGIDPKVAAMSKARGVLVTEADTPILGKYFRAMIRSLDAVDSLVDFDLGYMHQLWGDQLSYPAPEHPYDVVASQLGVTVDELHRLEAELDSFEGDFEAFKRLELDFRLPDGANKLPYEPVLARGVLIPEQQRPADVPQQQPPAANVVPAQDPAPQRNRNRRGRNNRGPANNAAQGDRGRPGRAARADNARH